MAIRPATPDDEAEIERILVANDEPIAWPGVPGLPYLDFLIDAGRTVVAETGDGLAGFAASVRAGPITHLCDLFVDPAHHGRGLGQALLAAVMPADGPRTTFASADPRALPIYARSGMRPSWPVLYLQGPAGDLPPGDPESTVSLATPAEAGAAERQLGGSDRSELLRYQASLPGAALFTIHGHGRLVAVGVARDGRRTPGRVLDRMIIGPDVAPDVGPTAVLLTALHWTGDGNVAITIPGPHPALPLLLESGFRITDADTYCESEPGLVDPVHRIPDTSFL